MEFHQQLIVQTEFNKRHSLRDLIGSILAIVQIFLGLGHTALDE